VIADADELSHDRTTTSRKMFPFSVILLDYIILPLVARYVWHVDVGIILVVVNVRNGIMEKAKLP